MSWISPIKMNMGISERVLDSKPDNLLIQTAQKIAIYSVLPFSLIVLFEAVIKNLIFINLANLGILILNTAHDFFASNQQEEMAT